MSGLIDEQITQAIQKLSDFIEKTTGQAPTATEIADALTKYFVLNEIKDHIVMLRKSS